MDDFISRMREKTYAMAKDPKDRELIQQNIGSVKGMLSNPRCAITLCGHGDEVLDIDVPKECIDSVDEAVRAVQADAMKDLTEGEKAKSAVVIGMYNASTEAMVMLMQDASQRYLAAHPDLTERYWGAGATMALQVWMNRRFGLKMNVDVFFILTAMANVNGRDHACVEITTLVDGGAMTQMSNAECIRVFGEDEYAKMIQEATEAVAKINEKMTGFHVFRILDGSFVSMCESDKGMIYPAPLYADGEALFQRLDMRGLS